MRKGIYPFLKVWQTSDDGEYFSSVESIVEEIDGDTDKTRENIAEMLRPQLVDIIEHCCKVLFHL